MSLIRILTIVSTLKVLAEIVVCMAAFSLPGIPIWASIPLMVGLCVNMNSASLVALVVVFNSIFTAPDPGPSPPPLFLLPTYITHTTATKTQTHVQHSPCPHRIGKAQTQFSHPLTPSPPTPPPPSPPTPPPEPNTYTCHTLHQHLLQARHLY